MAYVPDYRVVDALFNPETEHSSYIDFFRTTKVRSQQLLDSLHQPESSDVAAISDYKALTLKYPKFKTKNDTELLGVYADVVRSVCNDDAPGISLDTLKKYTDDRVGDVTTGINYINGFASAINLLPDPAQGAPAVVDPQCQGNVIIFDLRANESISIVTSHNERVALNCSVNMNVTVGRGNVNAVRYSLTASATRILVEAVVPCRVYMRSSLPIDVDANVDLSLAEAGYQLFMLHNVFTDGTVLFMTLAEYVTNLIASDIGEVAPGIIYQAFEGYFLLSNALSQK